MRSSLVSAYKGVHCTGSFAENMDSKKLLKQAVPFFRLIQGDRLIYGPLYSSFTENRLGFFCSLVVNCAT